jgi:hypothetical protein
VKRTIAINGIPWQNIGSEARRSVESLCGLTMFAPSKRHWVPTWWVEGSLIAGIHAILLGALVVAIPFRITGRWTDYFAPKVLPDLAAAIFPFLFLPSLLIFAVCLRPRHRNVARTCLKWALVAFVVGIVWQFLAL